MKYYLFLLLLFFNCYVYCQDNNLYLSKQGNIGIGKIDPSQKLEIQGNSKINGKVINENSIQVTGDLNTSETIKDKDGNDLLPVGSIIMWASPQLPNENWKICDGRDGTPDLKDRFVIGVGRRDDNFEGEPNLNRHFFELKRYEGKAQVTLTSKEIPPHSHTIYITNVTHSLGKATTWTGYEKGINSESLQWFYESENIDKMEGKPMDNLPPYYTLYFIIKVK